MPDKTPASALEGVELCERVALGMGWTFYEETFGISPPKPRRWEMPDGTWRTIGGPGTIIYGTTFDPLADGNHLAEVIAEVERRGWLHLRGLDLPGHFAQIHSIHPETLECLFSIHQKADTEAVAFLRAFVAACEAEKATSWVCQPS